MGKVGSCGFCMYEAMEKRRSEFVSGVCAKGMTGYLYLQRNGGVLWIFWTCFRSLMQNIDAAKVKVQPRVHFSPTAKNRHPKWATIINSTLIRPGRACGIPIAEKRHLYACQPSICSWKGRYKHKNCNPIPTEISIHDSNCEGAGPVSLN